MPEGSFYKVYATCPFYKNDDMGARSIVCEGIVDKSSILLRFSRTDDYRIQMEVFCCQHYEKCEIYRMLMENKYEEDEE